MSPWRSTDQHAWPGVGERVLIYTPSSGEQYTAERTESGWALLQFGLKSIEIGEHHVSHWRPLPEGPQS